MTVLPASGRYSIFPNLLLLVLMTLPAVKPALAQPVPPASILPPVFGDNYKDLTQDDPRVRKYITPLRIVWQSDESEKTIENEQKLLKPGNGQAELINNDLCILRSTATEKPGILLDFGKELHGGLELVTGMMKSKDPVKVRIRFGESVSEAMSDIDTVNGATNDHAMRDFIVELPWLGALEVGNSAFRFVRIYLVDPHVELLLKEDRESVV